MTEIPSFAFEAAGQAAGYYFQLRFALLRALQQVRKDPAGSIAVERIDDVSVWSSDTPLELDQLKHTTGSDETFTDYAPAVWRTIGNWSTLAEVPGLKLDAISLVLITNASVGLESALAKLGPDPHERDAESAEAALVQAATSSSNATSAVDRKRFMDLQPPVRKLLVRSMTVVPNSPNLGGLGAEIEEILHYACETGQLKEFREELEGWWLQRVASGLSGGSGPTIQLTEVDAKVSFLREKHRASSLDIDAEAPALDDALADHIFIRQMQAVSATERRLRNAQRDFLRASTQRSRWLRDLKIDPEELTRYDAELEDHWTAKSTIVWDELKSDSIEAEKEKAGRALLGWAEMHQVPIKGAAAQFLTSGSYHALADQMKVGWHPDYVKIIKGG